jgi:hypothetical protein
MGNDPAASTKFLHDNMDRIPAWMKDDSDHHGGLPDFQAKAFAGVIRAGTLDGMGADTKLAADNSEKLINYYAEHSDEHTHSDIQKAFGDIITCHWDDVQSILVDPAPADLGADHISVSEDNLRAFIDEAMRNPDSTATLMAFSKNQANFIVDNSPDNHEAAHASGLLNGIFTYEAMKTYGALNAENAQNADDWNSSIQTQLTAVTGAGIEIAFAPNEAAATVSKAVVNDVVGLFVADVNLVDKGSELTPPGTTSWHDEWQQAAHLAYMKDPEVGNPGKYADEYCNGKNFLDSGGRLIDGASQQQKIAYNAWLKDQGLAHAANPHFIDMNNGRHDGSPVTGG